MSNSTNNVRVFLVNCWQFPESPSEPTWERPVTDCLGIGQIAAVLRQEDYPVHILDAHVSRASPPQLAYDIARRLRREPFVLGFSFMYPDQIGHAVLIARDLLGRGLRPLHVTAGGVFASRCYQQILTQAPDVFDSVVWGEGENTTRELLARLSHGAEWRTVPGLASWDGRSARLQPRDEVIDLDTLPWPSRDTLDAIVQKDGVPNISASRGCPSACLFCMSRAHLAHLPTAHRWRCRSAANVADEIEWLVREKGVTRLNFVDENTLGDRSHKPRLMALADEIEKRGLTFAFNTYLRPQDVDVRLLERLREVGLAHVFVGVESFWQPTLDRFNKRVTVAQNVEAIRRVRQVEGLRLYFGLMMYHPWVTMDEITANLQTVRSEMLGIPFTGPQIFYRLTQTLTIYKGSPIYKLAKQDRLLVGESGLDGWICTYALPDPAREHLTRVNEELSDFEALQHELDGACLGEPVGEAHCCGCGRVRAWTESIDAFIVDVCLAFAEQIGAGKRGRELDQLADQVRAEKTALIERIDRERSAPRP